MAPQLDILEKAARFLSAGDHYLLITHIRPDGDALGSSVALARWLRRLGKKSTVLLPSQPAPKYAAWLADEKLLVLGEDARLPSDCYQADHLLILDTTARAQLEGLEALLDHPPGPLLIMDHHAGGNAVEHLGLCLLDRTAAATGILVAEVIDHMGGQFDKSLAEPLFVAISTDTGWFRFSNTDPRSCRWAARLLESGLRPDALYRSIYQTEKPAKLRLIGELLSNLELYAGDRIAVMTITQEMFRRHGAAASDTENLIDEPQRIATVLAVALIMELSDGRSRISLRSKHTIDVNAIAQSFGGGGHVRAAGAYFSGRPAQAKAEVLRRLVEALPESGDELPPG